MKFDMKIIHFNSGLGNQLFQLMLCNFFREKGYTVFGYYNKKWLQQHNGLEINRVVDVDIPTATFYSNFIAFLCRCFHRFDKKGAFFASDGRFNCKGLYFSGYWQDKKFYQHLSKPNFRKFNLDKKNEDVVELMHTCNSVSLHVRRGDYLSPSVIKKMGNICTLDYYKKAIDVVKAKTQNPIFFVFSDDIQWARENIHESDVRFIDWNNGKDSFLDMYLMSHCKYHIIANSSFSYWGAYLSKENLLTVYPSRWYNDDVNPDIFFDDWVAIKV